MNAQLENTVRSVKLAKAEKAFDAGIAAYGSLESRLRSLDCKNRCEAVKMLAAVQVVRIYKRDGVVVVE